MGADIASRVVGLLARATVMAFELERRDRSGIAILTLVDHGYLQRPQTNLGHKAPANLPCRAGLACVAKAVSESWEAANLSDQAPELPPIRSLPAALRPLCRGHRGDRADLSLGNVTTSEAQSFGFSIVWIVGVWCAHRRTFEYSSRRKRWSAVARFIGRPRAGLCDAAQPARLLLRQLACNRRRAGI